MPRPDYKKICFDGNIELIWRLNCYESILYWHNIKEKAKKYPRKSTIQP